MASFTPNKGYPQPIVNGDVGVWGPLYDAWAATLDNNMGGTATVSVAGNTDVTASPTQAQCLIQNLTGALTGNINYILPALGSFYCIINGTSGNFSLKAITSAGGSVGVYIPQGTSVWVLSDGTNIKVVTPSGWQEIASYTPNVVATQPIPLVPIYRRFRLTVANFRVATLNDYASIQFSTNGGVSYISSAYAFAYTIVDSGGVTAVGSGSSNANIPLGPPLPTASSQNTYDVTVEINPGISTVSPPRVYGEGQGINIPGNQATIRVGGAWTGGTGPVNYCRFASGLGGNFSATVILEGLP